METWRLKKESQSGLLRTEAKWEIVKDPGSDLLFPFLPCPVFFSLCLFLASLPLSLSFSVLISASICTSALSSAVWTSLFIDSVSPLLQFEWRFCL